MVGHLREEKQGVDRGQSGPHPRKTLSFSPAWDPGMTGPPLTHLVSLLLSSHYTFSQLQGYFLSFNIIKY